MRIALDAMGGDRAPRDPIAGALEAVKEDGVTVLLVGREPELRREIERLRVGSELADRLEVVHADEVVEMEDSPITPIRRKRRSSIRLCAELVKEGRAEALVSAGNTGATMIAAKMVVGVTPGVDRPALATTLPNTRGRTVMLDAGANVDSKAHHLRQFAVMGHLYAQLVLGVDRPRIGLLSIGEEEGKGTDFTRQVFATIGQTGLNFVGNIEGRDVFNGAVDVVVCDGFVGNVLLKSAEALAEMIGRMLREEIGKSQIYRLGYALCRPAFAAFRRRTDYSETGGAPLLGLQGGCFIAHGSSSPKAIKNAIRRAVEFYDAGIHQEIGRKLAELEKLAPQQPEVTTP